MTHRSLCLLLCACIAVQAADDPPARKGGSKKPFQDSSRSDIPAHLFDVILGRPTTNTITVSVVCNANTDGWIASGKQPTDLSARTPARAFKPGQPEAFLLGGLQADTRYFYQFRSALTNSPQFTFRTARPAGSSFTFTVTADSHLDEHTDVAVYQRTLANALSDKPDFHIDLGDTFMTEKHASRAAALRQYIAQRYYFGQLCHSAPLFLVLGNHDGESPRGRGDESDSLAVWANLTRKLYFPNPPPGGFYSGDAVKHPEAGLLQDYYAWTWGDALFVVLDPYWFPQAVRGQRNNWKRSLGSEQYRWLKQTLEGSRVRFKFVFIHQLVGGLDEQGRGGLEAASLYEWGGHNADGSDGFSANRPGWTGPVHQLLLQNKVNIVFHGHDHLYAKQDLDGIVYQEVPQPGFPGNNRSRRSPTEESYRSGTILSSSGYLRVQHSPDKATVEYLKTASSAAAASISEDVAHRYTVFPR
jgi:predicted phosphodiesterase